VSIEFLSSPAGVPVPKGPYSQAVAVSGRRLLFLSGQVPEDEDGNLVGPGDMEAQTRQVLTNVQRIVEGAGGSLSDIVKIGVFLVDVGPTSYEVLGRVRREFFGDRFPASTMVEVKRLVSPEWLIEIEAWAAIQ